MGRPDKDGRGVFDTMPSSRLSATVLRVIDEKQDEIDGMAHEAFLAVCSLFASG